MSKGKPAAPPPPPVPREPKAREQLAQAALRLRDEQLRAHVVYVDPSLRTNAELDAITAQVVRELQALQKAGIHAQEAPADPQALEADLVESLQGLLEKMVSARREYFMRHKVETILRRVASLYLSSEVYRKSGDIFEATFQHADEALLAAVRRHEKAIVADLGAFVYADPTAYTHAVDRLKRFERTLASEVLGRSRPELERLLKAFREVLLVFFMRDFREGAADFAAGVVREAGLARGSHLSYKITDERFPGFREVFERLFLERLLSGLQAPLAAKLEAESGVDYRDSTLRFAADPRIYAEICGVMCNTVYEYLHGEGFLDLPVSWQQQVYE